MFLSVKDILSGKSFLGVKLLAGEKGLSRRVEMVTVGEVPDIAEWLTGNELVLSTFFAVSKNRAARLKFAKKIIESQAAALIVKSKRFVEEIDQEILDLADRKDFPIIEVPSQVRWTDLIQEVSKRIIGRNLANLERSEKIHNELVKLVIEGKGWKSIAKTAARLIKRSVVLENELHQVLAEQYIGELEKESFNELKSLKLRNIGTSEIIDVVEKERFIRIRLKGEMPAKVVVPIIVGGDILGFVSTFEKEGNVNDLDISALQSTATVAALEMGKERVKFETETRLYGDLMEDLLSSGGNEKEIVQRAKQFGVDLSGGAIAVFVEPDDVSDDFFLVRERFFEFLQATVKTEISNSIISVKRDGALIVLSPPIGLSHNEIADYTVSLARKLQKKCAERFEGKTFSVGIGRYYEKMDGISKTSEESSASIDVGRKLIGPASVTQFSQIGSYKILFDLLKKDRQMLIDFYAETLEPVVIYDGKHKSDLVATLSAYFKNNESVRKTSENIFVHPKTVGYRLQRIRDITGLDFSSSEGKERLSLGLKAGELLGRIDR